MIQDQFEQTVMQELREREERHPDPFSKEWLKQFEKNHRDLEEVMEAMQCQES